MTVNERIITVITDRGKDSTVEPTDADGHLDKLELTPTKFVKEVVRKLKKDKKD